MRSRAGPAQGPEYAHRDPQVGTEAPPAGFGLPGRDGYGGGVRIPVPSSSGRLR